MKGREKPAIKPKPLPIEKKAEAPKPAPAMPKIMPKSQPVTAPYAINKLQDTLIITPHDKPVSVSDATLLRTSADELLDLVKRSGKISVEEAAKKLRSPLATVQELVDFLVEERIFGIEYKFTTPYIYLYKEGVKGPTGKDKSFAKELITKEQFYEKAKQREVPYENIEGLWRKYLKQNLVHIREEFLRKANEKKVPEEKVEELWNKYLAYL